MNKKTAIIILGTAHLSTTPGKVSCDGRLREYLYSREIIAEVKAKLEAYGYRVLVDYEPDKLPKAMRTNSAKREQSTELAMRVNYVNEICRQNGAKNCLYVSVHVNAAGADGKWHDANGWSVYVSKNASANSKLLADCLYNSANVKGLKMRKPTATQKYWQEALYVLTHTNCPAVLTENLFQDNQKDVDFLLSDEGRHAIERLHVEGIMNYIERA